MKEEHITIKLNKTFLQKARLGIVSILMVMEEVDFNYLKERLKLSDGNLSSHLSILERERYIKIKKKFVKKKPKTLCQLTEKGHRAFVEYLDNLEKIIKSMPEAIKK